MNKRLSSSTQKQLTAMHQAQTMQILHAADDVHESPVHCHLRSVHACQLVHWPMPNTAVMWGWRSQSAVHTYVCCMRCPCAPAMRLLALPEALPVPQMWHGRHSSVLELTMMTTTKDADGTRRRWRCKKETVPYHVNARQVGLVLEAAGLDGLLQGAAVRVLQQHPRLDCVLWFLNRPQVGCFALPVTGRAPGGRSNPLALGPQSPHRADAGRRAQSRQHFDATLAWG